MDIQSLISLLNSVNGNKFSQNNLFNALGNNKQNNNNSNIKSQNYYPQSYEFENKNNIEKNDNNFNNLLNLMANMQNNPIFSAFSQKKEVNVLNSKNKTKKESNHSCELDSYVKISDYNSNHK